MRGYALTGKNKQKIISLHFALTMEKGKALHQNEC